MRALVAAFLISVASMSLGPPSRIPAPSDPSAITLLGAVSFSSPTTGWIALSSSAGYSLFYYQTSPPPVACGRATTSVYATDDGGRTWKRVLRFADTPAVGLDTLPTMWLHARADRRALVLSPAARPRAVLRRTQDGGVRWTTIPLPAQSRYSTVEDAAVVGWNNLWLLANLGGAMGQDAVRIYRSMDAGTHWTNSACVAFPPARPGYGCRQRSGIGLGGYKTAIAFANQADGVLTENNNSGIPTLSVTHDGGIQWHTVVPGLPHGVPAPDAKTGVFPYVTFQQPHFFGPAGILPASVQVCRRAHVSTDYACANQAAVLLSYNSGETWPLSRRLPFTPDPHVPSAWDTLAPATWRVAVGTTLWSTDDAGARWAATRDAIPPGYAVVRMRFVTHAVGWAIAARIYQPDNVAQKTQLPRTDDGGKQWSVVSLPIV